MKEPLVCLMPLPTPSRNIQEPALAAPTNKTELSQKVEAELFEEYDAMVPGPAAAVASFEGKSGDEIAQERTGRPLAINLDLLSWQAKQKNIKVRGHQVSFAYTRPPSRHTRHVCICLLTVILLESSSS